MEKIEFRLTDDEVKHSYLLIPKGKEKIFSKKEDFKVNFGGADFMGYLYFKENHQTGAKLKGGQYRIEFREPKPVMFEYKKTVVFTTEDKVSWKAELI